MIRLPQQSRAANRRSLTLAASGLLLVLLAACSVPAAPTTSPDATPTYTQSPTRTATPLGTPAPTIPLPKASEMARHSLGPTDAPVAVVEVSDFQ